MTTILSEQTIISTWQGMPGGPQGWLKEFGFIQYARAIESALLATLAQGPEAPDMLRGAQIIGGFIYALNELGTNRWWARVEPGQRDDGSRTPDSECIAVAEALLSRGTAASSAVQVAETARDAARYRWLRQVDHDTDGLGALRFVSDTYGNWSWAPLLSDALDAAIDTAMAAVPAAGGEHG